VPLAITGLTGVTVIDCKVALVTVKVVVPDCPPNLAAQYKNFASISTIASMRVAVRQAPLIRSRFLAGAAKGSKKRWAREWTIRCIRSLAKFPLLWPII
jgi:hypothetical protein